MTASPVIQLQNPVADHFETFIVSNAQQWQTRCAAEIEGTVPDDAYTALLDELGKHRLGAAFLESPAFHDAVMPFAMRYVVEQYEAKGQHLVLCGAGPSLRDHAAEWCPKADQVWGCNSAMTWLHKEGYRVTHGFTVDQTPHMVAEWASAPDVDYLIASTCHPHLTELLWGQDRRLRFFHNFVGIKKPPVRWADENGILYDLAYENWMYNGLFPPTLMCGSGLNAVTRALDLARFMGFEKVTVLGADCCMQVKGPSPKRRHQLGTKQHLRWLKKNTVMHADGGHALASEASPLTIEATIDGRFWMTKVDMAISAQWLVRMARASQGHIELVGDTLPNALMDKDEAFLRRLPNFQLPDGTVANLPVFQEGWV